MTTLTAESITFEFDRDHVVLRDLSLNMNPGEILVLLGGNGAGKTTLLRTLAGQLHPRSGQVLLDDMSIQRWSRREIRGSRTAGVPKPARGNK